MSSKLEAEISDTISNLKSKVEKNRSQFEDNEAAVSLSLVQPMLKALGWNVDDPNEVYPQPSTQDGRPDFELIFGNKRLFLETKKLGVDIRGKEAINQLAKYAFGEGVDFGLLSNGVQWVLFRSFEKEKPVEERKIWEINLEKDPPEKIILRLKTIARSNIEKLEELTDKTDQISEALQEVFLKVITGVDIKKEIKEKDFKDFALEKVADILYKEKKIEEPYKEKKIEEPLGRGIRIGRDFIRCERSYEILTETAEWVIKQGRLKQDEAPIESGSKRFLINRIPQHKSGKAFRAPKKLSNGLWMETHAGTKRHIKLAQHLLEHFGFKDKLEVYGWGKK
jgi:predicted type IV restriction endonuclease